MKVCNESAHLLLLVNLTLLTMRLGANVAVAAEIFQSPNANSAKITCADQSFQQSSKDSKRERTKKGADPNDDGGAQKGLKANVKRCAHGRIVTIDRTLGKVGICEQGKIVYVRLTPKTNFRLGSKHLLLENLQEGSWVTAYCAQDELENVASIIRIDD